MVNKTGVTVFLVSLCFIGMVLGGLFTYFYVSEEYDYEHMTTTMCNVTGEDLYSYQCSEEDCTGSGKHRHCHTHYYTCWSPYWNVVFYAPSNRTGNTTINTVRTTIVSGVKYRYIDTAISNMHGYHVGYPYALWYDRTNPWHARWSVPNPLPYLITMILGWSILLLSAVSVLVVLVYNRRSGYISIQ